MCSDCTHCMCRTYRVSLPAQASHTREKDHAASDTPDHAGSPAMRGYAHRSIGVCRATHIEVGGGQNRSRGRHGPSCNERAHGLCATIACTVQDLQGVCSQASHTREKDHAALDTPDHAGRPAMRGYAHRSRGRPCAGIYAHRSGTGQHRSRGRPGHIAELRA